MSQTKTCKKAGKTAVLRQTTLKKWLQKTKWLWWAIFLLIALHLVILKVQPTFVLSWPFFILAVCSFRATKIPFDFPIKIKGKNMETFIYVHIYIYRDEVSMGFLLGRSPYFGVIIDIKGPGPQIHALNLPSPWMPPHGGHVCGQFPQSSTPRVWSQGRREGLSIWVFPKIGVPPNHPF